jgi:hypothetical protein
VAVRHLDVAAVLDLSPRRNRTGRRALTLKLASEHVTLRDVIARAVEVEKARADARAEAEIGALLVILLGRLGLAALPSPRSDPAVDLERAFEGFRSGSYRVLLDGRPVTGLEETLSLGLRSKVTFLRVVPLVSG